jgi:hypothetical protein
MASLSEPDTGALKLRFALELRPVFRYHRGAVESASLLTVAAFSLVCKSGLAYSCKLFSGYS